MTGRSWLPSVPGRGRCKSVAGSVGSAMIRFPGPSSSESASAWEPPPRRPSPRTCPARGLEPDLLPRRHPRLRHATRLRRRSLSGSAGLLSPDRTRQVSRTDSCVPGPAASGISGSGDAAGNGWTGQTARSRLHAIAYFGLPRPARPSIHAESGSGPCGQGARKTIGNRLPDRLATIGRSAAPRILAAWNRPFFSGFILQ